MKYQDVKYWCGKCERWHRKYAKEKEISKTYLKCYPHKVDLSQGQIFIKDFKEKWKRYGRKILND